MFGFVYLMDIYVSIQKCSHQKMLIGCSKNTKLTPLLFENLSDPDMDKYCEILLLSQINMKNH